MVTALEIGGGFVLTVTLLTAMALSVFQLERLATRTTTSVGSRRRRASGTADRRARVVKSTTMMAALALFAALGGSSLVDAQVPEDCRRECSLDLEVCRNACIDSRDFDGCLEECHSAEEDCLAGCR